MPVLPRIAAALVAATGLAAAAAAPASAYEPCPTVGGWTDVTRVQVGSIKQFCKLPPQAANQPAGVDDLYFIKVPNGNVTQMLQPTAPVNSVTNPSRVFTKADAGTWLTAANLANRRRVMVINGTFFDDTSYLNTTTRIAFPVRDILDRVTGYEWLKTAAKVPSVIGTIDEINNRRCVGWGHDVRSSRFTYALADWRGVSTAMSNCVPGGNWRGMVGFEPEYEIDGGDPNALTIVGRTYAYAPGDTYDMCFLVGGWQNRVGAAVLMEEAFGCEPILQLDGGRTSNLAWLEPADLSDPEGGWLMRWPVDGYQIQPTVRKFPHALVIE